MRRGENATCHHFLLFLQCFKKLSFLSVCLKVNRALKESDRHKSLPDDMILVFVHVESVCSADY